MNIEQAFLVAGTVMLSQVVTGILYSRYFCHGQFDRHGELLKRILEKLDAREDEDNNV